MACRSHYVIERGRVIEAAPWTDEQIAAERRRDKVAKARHYGTHLPPVAAETAPPPPASHKGDVGLWARAKQWLSTLGR